MIDYRERFLKSLVLHVDKLALAIHRQADAVRANTEATEKATKYKEEQPPLPGSVSVELNKPVTVAIEGTTKAQIKNLWDWRDYIKFVIEFGGFVIEFVGLFVLIWYACTTYQLWVESQKQVGIMQKQLEATDRPWIKVEIVPATVPEVVSVAGANPSTPLTIDNDGGGVIVFSIGIRNIGKSVASRVDSSAHRVFATAHNLIKDARIERTRVCAAPSQSIQDEALFPDQSISANTFETFQTKQILAPPGESKTVYLFIVGCVKYEYPSSPIVHQTGFIYNVFPGKTYAEIHRLLTVPITGPPIHEISVELSDVYAN